MNGKAAKKLRRLAKMIGGNKTPEEQEKLYKKFKEVHKTNKGQK